jgi:hypothetical protein
VRFGRVPEGRDRHVVLEETLHGGALHTLPASVDQPDDGVARCLRLVQILIHDIEDIARPKRVQVDRVFNRNPNRLVVVGAGRMLIAHIEQ